MCGMAAADERDRHVDIRTSKKCSAPQLCAQPLAGQPLRPRAPGFLGLLACGALQLTPFCRLSWALLQRGLPPLPRPLQAHLQRLLPSWPSPLPSSSASSLLLHSAPAAAISTSSDVNCQVICQQGGQLQFSREDRRDNRECLREGLPIEAQESLLHQAA